MARWRTYLETPRVSRCPRMGTFPGSAMGHWGIEICSGQIPPWLLQPGSAGGLIALPTPRLGRDTEAPFVVVFELRKVRPRGYIERPRCL